jgi:hypothetical protein
VTTPLRLVDANAAWEMARIVVRSKPPAASIQPPQCDGRRGKVMASR